MGETAVTLMVLKSTVEYDLIITTTISHHFGVVWAILMSTPKLEIFLFV